jgi:hypothetical protein
MKKKRHNGYGAAIAMAILGAVTAGTQLATGIVGGKTAKQQQAGQIAVAQQQQVTAALEAKAAAQRAKGTIAAVAIIGFAALAVGSLWYASRPVEPEPEK